MGFGGIAGRLLSMGLGVALMIEGGTAQTVTGPIAGNPTLSQGAFSKAPAGYLIQEFFLSGSAAAYGLSDETLSVTGHAPFKTRLVVVRPADDKTFNGTVIVEWLNVSAGTDGAPDWTYLHRELVRKGYGWVGVSAQKVGIEGGPIGMPGLPPLKKADAQRYASLQHPGDAYAYDIFSKAGQAARSASILGGLKAKHVLAAGESQSAGFLTTYVNTVGRSGKIFDGYLIHSRFAGAAPLDGDFMTSMQSIAKGEPLKPVHIRSDIEAPVLTIITETDLASPLVGYVRARQPDTDHLRTWEIAGTAHADTYTLGAGFVDDGTASIDMLAKANAATDMVLGQKLPKPMNAAPQPHYVMQAALRALDRWVRTGEAPPIAERLQVSDSGALVLDAHGNARGGVRSPWVDVPTAQLSGLGQDGPGLLRLFGSTQPFDDAKLAALYPNGREQYLAQFRSSLQSAIAAGFILDDDREEIEALAKAMYPAD